MMATRMADQDAAHHRWWPKGVPLTQRVPRVTLPHYLHTAAARYPDKPALIFCETVLSYAELDRQVLSVAAYLQQTFGVKQGDRVLLISQNCPQYVVCFYAILCAGAVVVPVNPMSTVQEIRHFMEDSQARVACVAQELMDQVAPLMTATSAQPTVAGLDAVLVHAYAEHLPPASVALLPIAMQATPTLPNVAGLHRFSQALDQAMSLQPVAVSSDDLAILPYTSGTTGHPKGCCHSHASVLASNLASQVWRNLHVDSVMLCVAPLFHMLGMQNGMNVPITLGATVVMLPRWDAARALEAIERHRVSVWAAPPAMVMDLFAQPDANTRDLSSLTVLSGGGAAMPEAVATRLWEQFGLSYNEAYGLTETASFLHANPMARGKRQCLGVPTQGVESIIVDPQTLQPLPAGEVGELLTRGQQLMQGYWRNEAANREAFVDVGGKRFFRTGDLALVDEDGYFFMRDRLKRMINASGFKVWPAEVESLMYAHPAVREACVIASPDDKRGETVLALVVLKPEARVSVDELLAWCRASMAVYKAPRLIRFVDALPKSGTGKILWRELQAQEQARVRALDGAPT
jgi:fatty-acyl-CoA synthase